MGTITTGNVPKALWGERKPKKAAKAKAKPKRKAKGKDHGSHRR